MKLAFNIVTLSVIFFSSASFAQEEAGVTLNCAEHGERQYISASVLEQAGGNSYEGISNIRRRITANRSFGGLPGDSNVVPALVISEDAVTQFGDSKNSRMNKARRVSTLDSECTLAGKLDFDDVVKFGIPTLLPNGRVDIGASWRKKINLSYNETEIPVTISYKLERTDKVLGREVAVFSILLNGLYFGPDNRSKMRWAGVGYEIWDVGERVPLVKTMEIKYGTSFVEDVRLKLSYSESILF